ncbi:lipocalin-like domain-containing protein [Shewanella marina]|uniref:lipocalin-like domain-containing protein n=1 Tax=Shewanella marina TaxID=487319 RepID=UPI000472A077|nr:lipocalin-like domain-containing protein [Shewanella marina]
MKPFVYTGLLITLCACQPAAESESESRSMGNLLGATTAQYAEVLPEKQFSFPADHQAHNDFRQEWWYLTANLIDEQGQPLGLQWTQFRFGLTPNTEELPQDWQASQLYMAHSAITTKEQHWAEEKWSRGIPELAGVSANPFAVFIDNWRWQGSTNNLFPASLSVQEDDFSYQLQLSASAPLQLQGQQGYSVKNAAADVASYYYSQPYIQITGEVTLAGITKKVSGMGWLDREWSSQFLTDSQQGWDWFALRFNNQTTLMLFQLRADEASGQPHFYAGNLMQPDGSNQPLASSDIQMTAQAWQQTSTANYPVSWRLTIPSQQLDITINALNPNANMPLSIPYWEGPIQFSGSHQGDGYMELTGY